MLLTITTTHQPASDLSYLLAKRPDRCQSFDLSFGKARVFYPEVNNARCSACLLLDVDPVGMVRGAKANPAFTLGQYVNDRPFYGFFVHECCDRAGVSFCFAGSLQGEARFGGYARPAFCPARCSVGTRR